MEQVLKKIMARLFKVEEGTINDDSSISNIKAWDSLKHIELITSIEEEFKIPALYMEEIIKMTNMREIKAVLRSKGVDI